MFNPGQTVRVPPARPHGRFGAGLRRLAARPARDWRLAALALLVLLSAAALLQASLVVDGTRYYWLDDDQMISMRYARNLAARQGLVWNPGERVEGYSNPLWTLVMAGAHLLPVAEAHLAVVMKLLNCGLAAVVLLLSERLLRLFLPRPGLALPALLLTLAADLDLVYWSANGFETTLLTALFLLVIVRLVEEWQRGRGRGGTYLLMGLLPLVRSDAYYVWLGAAVLAIGLADDRRRVLRWLGLSLLLPAAHVLLRRWYYGDWFPNTYYLKVFGVPDRTRLGAGYLQRFARHYCVPLGFAASAVLWAPARVRWLLCASFVVAAAYVLVVGEDVFLYSRFLAHLVPLLLVLAIVGVVEVTRQRLGVQLAALIAIAAGVLVPVGALPVGRLVDVNGLPDNGLVTGLLIQRFTRPEARIAVVAAGNVGYFSHRYAVDLLGKSDPHVAREPAHAGGYIGHDKFDPEYSLAGRPDLVVPFWIHRLIVDPAAVAQAAHSGELYVARIVGSRTFRELYLPNPVPLPYLLQHNAVYVCASSPELARRALWRAPRIDEPGCLQRSSTWGREAEHGRR